MYFVAFITRIFVSGLMEEEEPITGKDQLEDEILLLNKRQAWKMKNEQQLEEVAFGEDMRKSSKDKELYEKLTEIDKKINDVDKTERKNCSVKDYTTNNPNSCNLSNEDKLRMLEEKINVYADNEREEKARGKKWRWKRKLREAEEVDKFTKNELAAINCKIKWNVKETDVKEELGVRRTNDKEDALQEIMQLYGKFAKFFRNTIIKFRKEVLRKSFLFIWRRYEDDTALRETISQRR